ncbi:MAG: hypothetical protein EBW87_01055 [Burkholderiaceae bacterium]|nr:hypothetical protein [Burkholderiaceae bacterium]
MNREDYRKNPIFGTDMTKPASLLTDDIRKKLVEARDILTDVKRGYGWEDRFESVEGLIDCGLTCLYEIMKEIAKHEIAADDAKFGESIPFASRGIGTDNCPGCFVCGGKPGAMSNIAAFVRGKEAGETAVAWFNGRARIDYRPSERNLVQVKFGACDKHHKALSDLSKLTQVHGVLRESMITEVVRQWIGEPE